jgi:hypothetical protein
VAVKRAYIAKERVNFWSIGPKSGFPSPNSASNTVFQIVLVKTTNEGLFELPHLNVTSGSYIFDFQRQIWLPNTLRIHDRKATDVEQGRWRTKFDNLRQIITRIVIGRTDNWPVTISDIWSLLKAVHDLRDAASLIADYYESVSMTTFGQRSLDDKAKMHRDLSLWCSISCKDMEDNVEALMACMDKDAEEDDVVNPLVVGLGTLGMQN